jgi:hypothetical protein
MEIAIAVEFAAQWRSVLISYTRSPMNYVIAILPDRLQAESAYTALEEQGLPMDKISIVGRGYQGVEELGAIDTKATAKKQAKLMASWLIPFGFIGGIAFSIATNLHTFAWAGDVGDRLIGGLLGAIGGGMGGFFIGGGTSIVFKSGDSESYTDRVNQGKYLIVVRGSQLSIQQATRILRELKPENMESYIDPYTV